MDQEHSQLFGLIAARMKKVTPDQVLAAAKKTASNPAGLAETLMGEGLLSRADCETIAREVENTLRKNEGDANATIHAQASAAAHEFDADFVRALDATLGMGAEATTVSPSGSVPDSSTVAMAAPPGGEAATVMTAPGGDTATVAMASGGNFSAATVVAPASPGASAETVTLAMTADPDATMARGIGRVLRRDEAVPAVQEHPGRYQHIKEFGAGGMGQIHLVHDQYLGRDVALKQLLTTMVAGASYTRTASGAPTASVLSVPMIARFLQEARVTGQLEHPSIVPVYELGYRDDGSLYYTMKLVRGRTLQDCIDKGKTLRGRLDLLTHFLDLCNAMAYAHSRNVVHRDLKPLNVMIGEFGETVVIDWGIAKVRGAQDVQARELAESIRMLQLGEFESSTKTMYGQAMGSPYYMPPEQATGAVDRIDERSDVYALGAILYIILTGKPPYFGMKAREFLEKVVTFPPKPVRTLDETIPPELAAVCEKAMQRKPEDRYPSAKELAKEIQAYISGGLVGAYAYSPLESIKRLLKKYRAIVSISVVAALVLLTVWGVYSYRLKKSNDELKVANVTIQKKSEEVTVQRNEARHSLYAADVALAGVNLDDRLMQAAREHISGAPAEYRGWEWGHLLQRVNADSMTLKYIHEVAAVTASGQQVVGSSLDGTVRVYDAVTGESVRTLVEGAGDNHAIKASADGGRVAVSGAEKLVVFEVATGKALFEYAQPKTNSAARHLAFSADGAYVATACTDKQARLWKVGEAAPLLEIPLTTEKSLQLRFDPTGTRFLVIHDEFGENGTSRVLELRALPSGEVAFSAKLDPALPVNAAVFSPDGTRIALGSAAGVQVVSTDGLKPEHVFEFGVDMPESLAFSPDGQWLAAGGMSGDVAVWNAATFEEVKKAVKGHEDKVNAVAFSHSGQWLATVGDDRTARLWEVPSLRPARTFVGHDSWVVSVVFHPKDHWLITGSKGQAGKIWDLGAAVEFVDIEKLAFSPVSGLLAGTVKSADARLQIWSARTGRLVRELEPAPGKIERVAFNAKGTTLASVAASKLLWWNAEAGGGPVSVDASESVSDLFFGGDARLAVRTKEGLAVYDTVAAKELFRVPLISAAAFSADGAWLAVGVPQAAEDGRLNIAIQVIDGSSGEKKGEFVEATTWPKATYAAPAFAFAQGAGVRLFAGIWVNKTKAVIRTWDIAQNAQGPSYEDKEEDPQKSVNHRNLITALAISPDGKTLASASRDLTAKIWNIEKGDCLQTCLGHTDAVVDVAFSQDGKRIVTASFDGAFKIWDAVGGKELLTLQASSRTAAGTVTPELARFSADGRELVTLTTPVTAPIVLHAFPFASSDWGDGAPLKQDEIETYKRSQRVQ